MFLAVAIVVATVIIVLGVASWLASRGAYERRWRGGLWIAKDDDTPDAGLHERLDPPGSDALHGAGAVDSNITGDDRPVRGAPPPGRGGSGASKKATQVRARTRERPDGVR